MGILSQHQLYIGDFTGYQLVSNRHHVLATRPNTGYVRGAIEAEHSLSKYFTLTGGADIIASVHADHKVYLQQLYASLEYYKFFFEVGARENDAILRNTQLSSGTFAKGTNAKPIPQVRIGIRDFWTVPYTNGWLQPATSGQCPTPTAGCRFTLRVAMESSWIASTARKSLTTTQTSTTNTPQASGTTRSTSTSAPIQRSFST